MLGCILFPGITFFLWIIAVVVLTSYFPPPGSELPGEVQGPASRNDSLSEHTGHYLILGLIGFLIAAVGAATVVLLIARKVRATIK